MKQNPVTSLVRRTTSGAVKATPGRLVGLVLFGGATATSAKFTNDANGAGTPLLDVNVAATDTVSIDLSSVGGIYFSSKIYVTVAGTNMRVHVFYD
jgi:hypothetical protein